MAATRQGSGHHQPIPVRDPQPPRGRRGARSQRRKAAQGIPQGPTLAPLLFVLSPGTTGATTNSSHPLAPTKMGADLLNAEAPRSRMHRTGRRAHARRGQGRTRSKPRDSPLLLFRRCLLLRASFASPGSPVFSEAPLLADGTTAETRLKRTNKKARRHRGGGMSLAPLARRSTIHNEYPSRGRGKPSRRENAVARVRPR